MPFYVAAGIAAVGLGASVYEGIQAQGAQKQANQVAMRQDQIKTQNASMQMLQQNRITAAQVFANASNSGTGGSSSSVGTVGALQTQGAVQLNFLNSLNTLNQQRIMDLQSAQGSEALAGYASQFGSIGSSAALQYRRQQALPPG